MDIFTQAQNESTPEPRQDYRGHIVILHEKLMRRKIDRYMVNLALAFEENGYKVSIFTSQFDIHDCIEDIEFLEKIGIHFSGWWIPRTLFGFFRNHLSSVKAAWMAFRMMLYPPHPKPDAIILDVSMIAIFLLNLFTRYKICYFENFLELKNTDACFEHSKICPSLLEAKWIKLADEIIVETVGFAEVLKKSYPSLTKRPKVFYPSVDLGIWTEPGIKIQRIIPDLLEDALVFLSIGKYRRSSNFKLALDAFELLLEQIDDKAITKRFQLVIAGRCKTLEEKFYYNEMMALAKEKICASQITFLKQLPIIHEKTLILEALVMLHPARNDVYSDFILKAMSLGKPIIATNKGIASKLLVHRLSGIIIEPEPRIFALAMKKLVVSPHLQMFLGDMARDTFNKNFSFQSFCHKAGTLVKKKFTTQKSSSNFTVSDADTETSTVVTNNELGEKNSIT